MSLPSRLRSVSHLHAADIMTSAVVSTVMNAGVRSVARLMLEKRVGAAPVLDLDGAPVGMVSDGDLLGRRPEDSRRDWWLEMLARGAAAPEISSSTRDRPVSAVMTTPLISIAPRTSVAEVAEMLQMHRIKRLPVVENGRLIGIVSRTDLLPYVESGPSAALDKDLGNRLLNFLESLVGGASLLGVEKTLLRSPAPPAPKAETPHVLSADALRAEVRAFKAETGNSAVAALQAARLERQRQIKALLEQHVSAALWREMLDHAETAARNGEKELLLLQFPSDLCSDGGRSIDVAESGWEATLRGEAAEIYARWRDELRPRGFGFSGRIVSYYEDGVIGDIALYLTWGE